MVSDILEKLDGIERGLQVIKEELKDVRQRLDMVEERLCRVEKGVRRLKWRMDDFEEEMVSLKRRKNLERAPVIEPTPTIGGIMGCEWDESGQSLD